jgi:hypothetical protein
VKLLTILERGEPKTIGIEELHIAAALVAGSMGLLLGVAPAQAHADTGVSQFISDVNAAGISDRTNNNQELLSYGYTVCREVQSGMSPWIMADILYTNSTTQPGGITQDQAHAIVGAAVKDLC